MRTAQILKEMLTKVAMVNCASNQAELQQLLKLRAYDLVILDDDSQLLQDFTYLRSQFLGLMMVLTAVESLQLWADQARGSNTLLFSKPLHLEVLMQLCEQQLVVKELWRDEAGDSFSNDLQLSNLERRCLHLLLGAAAGKVHKIKLQQHLFGESSYLCDARLDSCWARLRKKLAKQAPHLQLRRNYNGFLEIAACTP